MEMAAASSVVAAARPRYGRAGWLVGWLALVLLAFFSATSPGCAPPPTADDAAARLSPSGLRQREGTLLRYVNQVRLERRLPTLSDDESLNAVARRKAAELARRGVLSHDDEAGRDFRVELPGRGASWRSAGEILARNRAADPAAEAVRGWQLSPAHRPELLDPNNRRVGVGAAQDATGAHYFVMLLVADG